MKIWSVCLASLALAGKKKNKKKEPKNDFDIFAANPGTFSTHFLSLILVLIFKIKLVRQNICGIWRQRTSFE